MRYQTYSKIAMAISWGKAWNQLGSSVTLSVSRSQRERSFREIVNIVKGTCLNEDWELGKWISIPHTAASVHQMHRCRKFLFPYLCSKERKWFLEECGWSAGYCYAIIHCHPPFSRRVEFSEILRITILLFYYFYFYFYNWLIFIYYIIIQKV